MSLRIAVECDVGEWFVCDRNEVFHPLLIVTVIFHDKNDKTIKKYMHKIICIYGYHQRTGLL